MASTATSPAAAKPGSAKASELHASGSPRASRLEPRLAERLRQGLHCLTELRELLGACEALRMQEAEITGICDDSREIEPGGVFFAVPGLANDGAGFAAQAVAQGACAVVSRRPLPVPVPVLLVEDVRRAASLAAAAFYGHPSSCMPVVGVTGTNGKTSTSELVALCLEDALGPVGVLGTVRYRLGRCLPGEEDVDASGERQVEASHTTPGPVALQRYLAEMRRRDVRAAILEISSHALDQGRAHAVQVQAAVFTNLSLDHLDYHGTMEEYASAKARLFAQLRPGSLAVLPYDDVVSLRMLKEIGPGVRVIGYGLGKVEGQPLEGLAHDYVRAEILEAGANSTRVRFCSPEGQTEVELPLIGSHNVRNALAALSCAIGLDIGPLHASDSLSRARPVAGRLEELGRDAGHGRSILPFRVFVDYAHTPDALERVLVACRQLCTGKLRLVFGCGGDRDRNKRPKMGTIARNYADHVVVTQDNPRGEEPTEIVEQILSGMQDLQAEDAPCVEICHDRARAIRHALSQAQAGDLVLIAGKGHETGQVIGQCVLAFDDREEVRKWLRSR